MGEIYQPEEDSYLLQRVIKNLKVNKKIKILDMGSGSGIQAQTFIEKGAPLENITLADINPRSIKHLKKNFPKSIIIKSDLFKNIKGKFDFIVFNPPYLPEDKFDKKTDTTGGKKGSEIINKFLTQSRKHLTREGKIFLLTSSLTKNINWNGYKKKLLAKKKIFFEELFVWGLAPGN